MLKCLRERAEELKGRWQDCTEAGKEEGLGVA